MNDKVFFGTKEVSSSEKQNLVNEVFSSVSSQYDIMNDIMSFGIHRLWKQKMVDEIFDYSKKILDVAGGTGDIVRKCYERAIQQNLTPDITLFDINESMLKVGRDKLLDLGIIKNIQFICGNAEEMPIADDSFDYYTCAFGIRNMTHLDRALSEAYRVLSPGGKFICMEFSHISNDLFAKIYDIYSKNFIPNFGKMITNDKESYKYLVESIKKFPNQKDFAQMIEKTGFKAVTHQNLTGGICAIHIGYKL